MGSELVDNSQPDNNGSEVKNAPILSTFTEFFKEQCPYYMSIGMTYDEFWNGDCELPIYYRKAEELKNKKKNQELWLQGLYFYEALCDVAPVLHAFAKKGTKPIPYSKEPYALTEQEHKERKERDRQQSLEILKARLLAMASKKQ